MHAKFIQDGHAIDYRPTTPVAAGSIVKLGALMGVAKRDIPADTLGALAVTGVFEVLTEDSGTLTVGDVAYWNATDGFAESASNNGANPRLGVAVSDSYAVGALAKTLVRLG